MEWETFDKIHHMRTKDIEAGLTRGLVSGYGGETNFSTITRGSFPFKASHLEENGLTYHDEWLSASTGGGQELLKVRDQQFTRLYAGGVVQESTLTELGITEEDVIAFLKSTILEQQENTRLFKACKPEPANDWSYSYQILDREEALPITFGKETISYRDRVVFVHSFLLCLIT